MTPYDYDNSSAPELEGPESPKCAICGDTADQAYNNVDLCAFHFRRELTATSKHLLKLEAQQ